MLMQTVCFESPLVYNFCASGISEDVCEIKPSGCAQIMSTNRTLELIKDVEKIKLFVMFF